MHKQHRLKRIMKLITAVEIALCVIMIISVFATRYYTLKGIELSKQYMNYTDIANEINKSSDNLTEDVRMFVESGNSKYMKAYHEEADASKHRIKAIEAVKEISPGEDVLSRIEQAINASENLVYIEHYAIKLAALGYGIPEGMWPEDIKSVNLNSIDNALTAEAKKETARKMVFSENYAALKRRVAFGTSRFLANMIENSESEFLRLTNLIKLFTRLLLLSILSVAALLLLMNIFQFKFVVNPIVRAAIKIRNGCKIKMPYFLKEMDYLEKSYNELYTENASLLKQLRIMAETDALTKLGNRTAYNDFGELIQSEGGELILFVFDVDNLRVINNTQGHAAGDEILRSAADCIKDAFGGGKRQNCFRLGGDEFVAVISGEPEENAAKYIEKFAKVLKKHDVGISVGYAYTDDVTGADLGEMFKQADKMMYAEKEKSKSQTTVGD